MGGDKIVLLDGAGSASRNNNVTDGFMSMIPGLFANIMGNTGKTDPNLIAALANGRNNQDAFGGNGAWWIWIFFLWALMGGRNGFGGFGGNGCCMPYPNGLPENLNNNYGFEMLMQAVQGSRTATEQLASSFNCSISQVQNAICTLQGSIDKVAGQLGTNAQMIINSIQNIGCEIGNQINSCCCNLTSLINQSTCGLQSQINQASNLLQNQINQGNNTIQNQIGQATNNIQNQISQAACTTQGMITQQGYESQLANLNQTNVLQNSLNQGLTNNRETGTNQFNILSAKIDAQTQLLNSQFCELEKREMQREINSLREAKQTLELFSAQQTQTANIISAIKPCPIPAYITCNPYDSTYGQRFYSNNNNCCQNNCCQNNCCGNANV